MPGRQYYSASGGYRYGFNGKENDNDVKGEGNQQDYGMRIYDPRLGRFLSVDPLQVEYPELTPYQFASNSPIDGVDLDGLEYTSSKHPKISPFVSYDPVQKRITEVTTSLIYQNFIGYSRRNLLQKYGPPGADWQTFKDDLLIEVYKVSFQTNSASDIINNVVSPMDSKEQLEAREAGGNKIIYTSPTANPASKKFSDRVTRNNGTSGVKVNTIDFSSRGDKVGAYVTGVTLLVEGIAALISSEEFSRANNQSSFILGKVALKLNSWFDKIPDKFRNSQNLTEIASYLLNGEMPTMITASGRKETNKELLDISTQIWNEIDSEMKQGSIENNLKRRIDYMAHASVDNTANNAKPKPQKPEKPQKSQ